MDFFEKLENNPYQDLYWNIPETKQGILNIIGGNGNSFRTEMKVAEFLTAKYPVREVNLVLPDALKKDLPELPNLSFLKSTESGSFGDEADLSAAISEADFNLLLGDLSKNSITEKAVASAVKSSEKPLLITRDAVDLVSNNLDDETLMNGNSIFLVSLTQLQKIFKAVYYPKMITLSQPLSQVAEALHKFTLSYITTIIVLCNGQILVAKNGIVKAISLEKTGFSPITIWGGEMSAKIAALNLYNPGNTIEASVAALFE